MPGSYTGIRIFRLILNTPTPMYAISTASVRSTKEPQQKIEESISVSTAWPNSHSSTPDKKRETDWIFEQVFLGTLLAAQQIQTREGV
ncbi:MAG TPA: hypothetical protein VE242_15400, partial [Chthoniobacterales bacterium]|nr:hypothetical protein [Chthoniobacterales bacterium]